MHQKPEHLQVGVIGCGHWRPNHVRVFSELDRSRVQCGASIGAGAVILSGIQIGAYPTIGAGAVVTHNVPAQRLALGNPARLAGWVCRCGAPLPDVTMCSQCDRKYRLVGDLLIAAE